MANCAKLFSTLYLSNHTPSRKRSRRGVSRMSETLKIQARLSAIPCPICKQSQFSINPQTEKSYTENFYKARCNNCAYTFTVSTPTKPIRETNPDVDQWLGGLSCPSCQERGAELDLRCVPSVRDCIYFVTCNACRHPYHENAPMEAYE